MKRFTYLFSIFLIFALFSCKNDGNVLHKNITGKAGEMVVVISKEKWDGQTGKTIKKSLAQEHLGLPQDEPIFSLIDIPKEAFKAIFQSTRNILITHISPNEEEKIAFKKDVWAYPQAVVEIYAQNDEQFQALFNENQDKIVAYFLKAERDRLSMNYKKYYDKAVLNTIKNKFDATMYLPMGFTIAKETKDFVWSRFETPEISQGVVVFSMPYTNENLFSKDFLVAKIDSVLKQHIPGPTKGSYMALNKELDQLYQVAKHNGNYATQMRGLWRVENDFMGGPYILLSELDAANQRMIVSFGYVYAPSKKKRNLLRQVEAMIYSLKLNNQEKNDKINKKLEETGN